MPEPVTSSACINTLISKNVDDREAWQEFKDTAVTEFEKWFYNHFKPHGITDELKTTYTCGSIAQELFDRYVPRSGPARTGYGEFIRAYHKLVYRWLNDGDDPIYGPYSALNEKFLEDYKDRHFRLHDGCLEMYAPYNSGFDETQINNFVDIVNRNICLFECRPCDVDLVSDMFFAVLDCVNDKLKGVDEKNYNDCAEYYKNSVEYTCPKIYEFLTEKLGIYNIRYIENGYGNDIEELDNIISVQILYYNRKFILSIRTHKPDGDVYEFENKKYEIDLQEVDENSEEWKNQVNEMKTLVDNEKEYIKKRYGNYGNRY